MEFVGDRVLATPRLPNGLRNASWEQNETWYGWPSELSQPVLGGRDDGLGESGLVTPGEAKAGVRRRSTVLTDALEAALGASSLNSGERAHDSGARGRLR